MLFWQAHCKRACMVARAINITTLFAYAYLYRHTASADSLIQKTVIDNLSLFLKSTFYTITAFFHPVMLKKKPHYNLLILANELNASVFTRLTNKCIVRLLGPIRELS